jgi:hypothetical protein
MDIGSVFAACYVHGDKNIPQWIPKAYRAKFKLIHYQNRDLLTTGNSFWKFFLDQGTSFSEPRPPAVTFRCCGHGPRRVRRRAGIRCTWRVTPAMAAGVTDRLWEVSDLVALLEADERGLERAA